MNRFVKHAWLIPIVVWVIVLVLPSTGVTILSERDIILIGIYCLVTAGINLSFGYGGELALGQVAIMAAGAYATLILGQYGITDIALALLAACVVGALLGVVTGLPGLRLSKWSLGLTSFFLIMLLPGVVTALRDHTGGLEGRLVELPTLLGNEMDTSDLYLVTVVVAGLWLAVFRNLILSNYGVALRCYQQSPQLVESLGVSANTMRLSSYVVGAVPAAMGGVLYAHLAGYLSPYPFSLALLLAVLAASIFGGSASIYGPVIGAVVLVVGPAQIDSFELYSMAVFGAFLVVVAGLFSHGVAGYLNVLLKKIIRPSSGSQTAEGSSEAPLPDLAGGHLSAQNVTKDFGGVRALNNARLEARPGQLTAIIGSNGAGKTTLLNLISGFIKADEGQILIDGQSIVTMTAPQVAKSGVSRAFQTPAIPASMTVQEVVASGMLRASSFGIISATLRLPAHRRSQRQALSRSDGLLRLARMHHLAHEQATTLPLGSRRLLEVLRAAVASPKVIMLDEPAAGLDEQALEDLANLLRTLRDRGATIILIEHNVPFVMSVAETVFAMDLGRVIASGNPDEVRTDPHVVKSYLGRSAATHTDPAERRLEGSVTNVY